MRKIPECRFCEINPIHGVNYNPAVRATAHDKPADGVFRQLPCISFISTRSPACGNRPLRRRNPHDARDHLTVYPSFIRPNKQHYRSLGFDS